MPEITRRLEDGSLRPGHKLCLAVYRLTETFPSEEPLRKKLRELALEAAAPGARSSDAVSAEEVIETMIMLLAVAREQGFAKAENFQVLAAHYRELKNNLSLFKTKPAEAPPNNKESDNTEVDLSPGKRFNPRQKKIIQHFRYRQTFRLREARALFEGYSQKTLRNDLKELCQTGILNREGVGTASFYRVGVDRPLGKT